MPRTKTLKDRTTIPPSQLCDTAPRRHMRGMQYALASHLQRGPHSLYHNSHIAKIDNYNAWLGVQLLFKHLPTLETWLKEAYNDKFVTGVRLNFPRSSCS